MKDITYRKRQIQSSHDSCGIGAVVSIDGKKSYEIVDNALSIVEKLEHRAGKDAKGETGDGVGIMMQISHKFFTKAAKKLGIKLGEARTYGVGMFFFPSDALRRNQAKKMLEIISEKEGVKFLGWRTVPVNSSILGEKALDCMPCIVQGFFKKPAGVETGLDFDRKLYIIRRTFEQSNIDSYVVSLSSRTIVYKGMFLVNQLRLFYCDLQDGSYESALAMVHSRFSTNTAPSWERAHPNRLILHNGEINTIKGNVDRMFGREESMKSPVFGEGVDKIYPVVNDDGSDSAMLDNTLEFLMMNGMELPKAVMVTIPEPWRNDRTISRGKKDFFHYYSTMMEPWDGPAAILFSDGDIVGAALDRNGLRPARYYVTDDNMLILASEVGVLDIPAEKIVKKSRIEPGSILTVDLQEKRIITDGEMKKYYAQENPYGEWVDQNLVRLSELAIPNKRVENYTQDYRDRLYKAFGYTYEDVKEDILPMARDGFEGLASMGTDVPLAVLSNNRQPLFNCFKQRFAQVTNPPMDAIREEIVTDTHVYVGSDGNLLNDQPGNCNVLEIKNPILTSLDLMKIKAMKRPGFKVETISLLYYKNTRLETAIDHLFIACDKAYSHGANVLILSDRGVDEYHVAIPSLLAVSAVEHYLVRTKKRTAVSMILESGEPRCVHHFATLLGYGARAVNPYLAQDCIAELVDRKMLDKDTHTAIDDYNMAILRGIVKIASKMGICTLQSYQSSQIFEAIGVSKEVIDKYFTNTVSRVGGIDLHAICTDVEDRHNHAFDPLDLGIDTTLDSVGIHRLRSGDNKEDHLYNPAVIAALRDATQTGDYKRFKEYSAMVDVDESGRTPHTLRGLLELNYDPDGGIPVEEVEPVSEIVKRFKTGAMSYGSISQEAHECLALAMNRIGGKSNTGEGGELTERLGTEKNSAIKQVASGRFGITSGYLCSAEEIQIKMAQGAKPGEGGHLPGSKVYPWIAKARYSTPYVSLISPPPHHDIYSIEDLAQLIFDLKNANKYARISVKLVSEAGVGTIASGVAKAGAQVVLISGYDGGTGAAGKSSIHDAGMPWELGLAEAHQTLIENGLRQQVILETDGKLMTGVDVAIAALLGAEEFGFATAPLIAMGCVMMRVCNLDTCPCGIATQNPELRKRFCGKPEYVINFMNYIAMELREIMAKLGVRRLEDMVGRTDLLKVREKTVNSRAATLDMAGLLRRFDDVPIEMKHFQAKDKFDFKLEDTIDENVLIPQLLQVMQEGVSGSVDVNIDCTDRTLGTLLGSEITRKFGDLLKEDTYEINCVGGAGQSFGAFIPKGLTMRIKGDSNDYFGKGLSGGKLVVSPPEESTFAAVDNIIIGNVALYGATSGQAYINGRAGERFAVRNSGAIAVVEGVGNHGCEYMTGGKVVILGSVGKNFAAGMSGGVVYVLDERHNLYLNLNQQMASMEQVTKEEDIAQIKKMIRKHVNETDSPRGSEVLENFDEYLQYFIRVSHSRDMEGGAE